MNYPNGIKKPQNIDISTKPVDYKNVDVISKYINDSGKILPRRFTGTCAKHQRHVAEQVKLARFMGFIPYTNK